MSLVFYFIGLAIYGIPFSTNAQDIFQTTLQDGRYACSNSEVIFTCRTVGSADIVWQSTDYIGSGAAQLLFIGAASDPPVELGSPTYPSTVATLTKESGSGETLLLESTLSIRTSLLSSHSSVTCTNTTNDIIFTVSFTVLPDPEMPSEMISEISNQTMDVMGICIILLSWRPPANMDSNDLSHYIMYIDGDNVMNKTHVVTSTSSLQQFAYSVCNCSERTVHTVGIQAVSRCERAGSKTESVTAASSFSFTCDVPTTEPNTNDTCKPSSEQRCQSDLKGIITLLFVAIVVLVGE